MFDENGFIDQILAKYGEMIDARGVQRVLLHCEILQMLTTLQTGLKNQRQAHQQEKQVLLDQIEQMRQQIHANLDPDGGIIGGEQIKIDLTNLTEENQNG